MKCLAGVALGFLAISFALPAFPAVPPWRVAGARFLNVNTAVRSQGMGSVGVADDMDPANVFFNPAVIASARGAFLTFGYSPLSEDLVITDEYDVSSNSYTYNAGAGGSLVRSLRGDWKLRIGAGFRYNSFVDESVERSIYDPELRHTQANERYASFTLGAGCALRNVFCGSIGLAVKPWENEYGVEPFTTRSKTAYDVGLLAQVRLVDTDRLRLLSSAGVSFLNLGGDIGLLRVLPETSVKYVLPQTYRYGLGLRFEGLTSSFFWEHFGAEVPVVSASIDYDFIDNRIYRENDWALGGEVALYQVFFMRMGYVRENDYYGYSCGGLGAGFTLRSCWGRFDYTFFGSDDCSGRYGLSLGFSY